MLKTKVNFDVTKYLKKLSVASAVTVLLFTSFSVSAQVASAVPAPTTIGQLTAAINFSNVSLGILAVAGSLIVVYILYKGVKMIITAVRGA